MKKVLFGLCMAAAAAAVQAEAPRIRMFASATHAWGGEALVSGTYVNGPDYELLAGAGWTWSLGGDLRLSDRLSLQASIGQQRNRIPGSNGEFDFQRNPVEVLAFYSVTEQVRLGAGARKVFNAKLTGTGVAAGASGTGDYDSTPGAVLEAQYLFTEPRDYRSFLSGLSLRFVRENYKLAESSGGTGAEKRADHVAVGVFFYY